MSMGFEPPLAWAKLDEATRAASWADSDFCEINDVSGETSRFIHCVLPLPVGEGDDEFTFTVWASVSERSWDVYRAGYGHGEYAEEGCFAFLVSQVPGFEASDHLPADLWFQPSGMRPVMILHRSAHPLVTAQADGINFAQIEHWASLMHQPPEPLI